MNVSTLEDQYFYTAPFLSCTLPSVTLPAPLGITVQPAKQFFTLKALTMRKHLFALVALATSLLGVQHLKAQNTSPYWSLAGNSNASATTSKLGTTNAIPLRLYTNNAVRVYVHPTTGNVGIATTAPAQKLHVVGNTYISSNLGVGASSPAQKLHVAGNTYITGSVGIGTNTLSYKLNVQNSSTAIYGNSTSGGYGVWGNSSTYGVYGTGGQVGVGVYGLGSTGLAGTATTSNGYGLYAQGGTTGAYGSGTTYGVYGASGNYGVYGKGTDGVYGETSIAYGDGVQANATGTGSSWGVNAYSQNSYGIWARTGNASSYAGYFAGSIWVTGTYGGSDSKLKQNITDIGSAIDVINKLQPKAYEYRQDGNFKLMNLPKGKHYGLIAQDLEEVLPDLVKETEFHTAKARPVEAAVPVDGQSNAGGSVPAPVMGNETNGEIINFKAVNYTELIPLMVKAMQEQQQMIEKLEQHNYELQQQIDNIKTIVNKLSIGQGFNAFLSSAQLGEVNPNPVKSTASIQYAIPEGSSRAQLLITDVLGRSIRQITLSTSGVINVDVTSLASGVYNYSLIVDNKTVATKKMTVVR